VQQIENLKEVLVKLWDLLHGTRAAASYDISLDRKSIVVIPAMHGFSARQPMALAFHSSSPLRILKKT
jgi:hypothetical protein